MTSNLLLSLFSLAVLLSATTTIIGHTRTPPHRGLIYLFKPLTTLLILVVALLPGTALTDFYAGGIAVGLVFSLAGDIFLMLPGNYFLYGLGSFLVTHLCYSVAFLPSMGREIFWPLLPLLVLGGGILYYLWSGVPTGSKIPVIFYIFILIGMATLALDRAVLLPSRATLSAALGGLLFLTSDMILAINRFRKPFALVHLAVLVPYFVGQWLIALSIALGA